MSQYKENMWNGILIREAILENIITCLAQGPFFMTPSHAVVVSFGASLKAQAVGLPLKGWG